MNPHVKSVRALEDYALEVSFDNGEARRFDVKPYQPVEILAGIVTPAKAGVQKPLENLDSGPGSGPGQALRRNDGFDASMPFSTGCYLDRGIFMRLRDRAAFEAVRVVAGSIECANGLDLSYDTLYVEGQPIVAPTPEAEPSNPAAAR